MVFYKTLVERCVRKREDLNLSENDLAERAGLNEDTIRNFESGSTHISIETFLKIMDALNFELTASSF